MSHGPSHLGVLAHTAALRHGGEWLDAVLGGLDRNRTLLADLLASHLPLVHWAPGAASYLAWLDFTELPWLTAAAGEGAHRGDVSIRSGAAAWLLEHARVLLSSGPAFGSGGHGCARINFATSAVRAGRGGRADGRSRRPGRLTAATRVLGHRRASTSAAAYLLPVGPEFATWARLVTLGTVEVEISLKAHPTPITHPTFKELARSEPRRRLRGPPWRC